MTTKVTITCQTDSHWDLKITAQYAVKHPDPDFGISWKDEVNFQPIILGPGESTKDFHNLYVHDSRRFVVEEKVRS